MVENNTYNVLVIEDEALFAKSLGIALTEAGMKPHFAEDGFLGLEKAAEVVPDIILLDNILPKMKGLDVLTKIKEEEDLKDIPVLMLTVLSDSETISKAISLGAVGYLIKSDYQLSEIVNKIRLVLEGK